MDPVVALSFVSESSSLADIRLFFEGALLATSEVQRTLSITKNLSRSQNLTVRKRHIELCRTRVCISGDTSCEICNRRIGTSAFTVSHVDGSLSHFGCFREV